VPFLKSVDKQIKSFLEEVGVNSEEHKKSLEKIQRVLDEMKNSSSSIERKHYVSFKETVDAFDRYLTEKKITLTQHEKDRFTIIASSGLNNLAKKRMAEDLIHQIKDRHAVNIDSKAETEKKKKEIEELKKSGSWLSNWLNLFRFALEFGTITLFSHRYRSESLDIIRINAAIAFNQIENELKGVLDNYYFYLSILEYNALVKLYETGKALNGFTSISRSPSFHAMEIFSAMNDFASAYVYVMRNIKNIDNGLKRVYSDRQPAHGFFGNIGFLTDRQLLNNRTIRHSEYDMMTKTIAGSLYSYFTCYLGVRVRTFYQLMYLTGEEGILNSTEKQYTSEALARIENESKVQKTEESRIKNRLSGLENITGKYSDMGKKLAQRLYEIEARSSLPAWNKEAQARPFFRLVKVADACLKHIYEFIINHSEFDLEYDGGIVLNYFERLPELVKAVDDYKSYSIELQGSRGKDLMNFKLAHDMNHAEFIKTLMEHENVSSLPGETRHIRETLSEISARFYNICMRFNEAINRFSSAERVESKDPAENYNFFINAKIKHPRVRHLESILNKKGVCLADLLEAGCSVSEYIAETLAHRGIGVIREEVEKLKKEIEIQKANTAAHGTQGTGEARSGEDEFTDEMNRMYTDRLTGFKKWEYFEDFIMGEFYDTRGEYKGDKSRQIFCAEIFNLADINRTCGNDAGDAVFRRTAEIIKDVLRGSGWGNQVLRGRGGLIIGYVNGATAVETVDLLFKILHLVREYSLASGIEFLPELVFNCGIYSERKGTNALSNIEYVQRIMSQGCENGTGCVAFLRNADYILTDKDFDMKGRMPDKMISVLK
jgi:GGDEF domain-containing protein/ACT domain-containing protein